MVKSMMKLSQKLPSSNYNFKSSKKRDNSTEDFDVYGKDLKILMDLSYSKEIPDLISIFEYFIKNYGLLVQGIFRVSGNKNRMEEIKHNYIHKGLIEVNFDDIHNITGLYKQFIREIPGGLIPYSNAEDLIKATKIHKKSENLDLITTELLKLPVPNYNLLKFTCSLLSQVCKCCGSNLMNSENLGTVFGPTFFASIEDISILPISNNTATILIQNYNELFKVSAPVHTNLNQVSDTSNRYGGVSNISANNNNNNNNGSKCSSDQNITIRFGESCLLINISNEMENCFLSNSFQEEETQPFSARQESSGLSNSFISTPQVSNSLALALKMCVSNHLFDQLDGNQFSNGHLYHPPNLIGNSMLNGYDPGFQPMAGYNYNAQNHYYANDRNTAPMLEKKRSIDENYKYSLPRTIGHTNTQQTYLNNYENSFKSKEPVIRPDTFSSMTKLPSHMEITHNRTTNQVPQLDLSTLIEPPEVEETKLYPKSHVGDRQANDNRPQKTNHLRQTIPENKSSESDSTVNQLQKRITALKNQLKQFESAYLSNNGVKPDKSVKLNNEWYQKILYDLKMLKHDREQSMNLYDKARDSENDSVKSMKRKPTTGAGDLTDSRFHLVNMNENRLVNSRPVSVMSESGMKLGINIESARSNTLNSFGPATSVIEDLSPREYENLKITLDQISNHLREERIRDHRPEDIYLMSHEEIECEKITMQKALLNFEYKYGRKKNPNAIQLMKPLYDRYRQVKKRLAQNLEHLTHDHKMIVQRTLDNRGKSNPYQSAWSSEKPLSLGFQPTTNCLDIIMPSNIPFDNSDPGEDSVSCGPHKSDLNAKGQAVRPSSSAQSNKRNSNTFQYRKPIILPNDMNNNNHILKNSKKNGEDLKLEFHKLLRDKKELQRILKDFEINFERETKRKVDKSDRLPMEREYARYKMIKGRIKELEEMFDHSMI